MQTISDPFRPFWTRVDHCGPIPTNADPRRPMRTRCGVSNVMSALVRTGGGPHGRGGGREGAFGGEADRQKYRACLKLSRRGTAHLRSCLRGSWASRRCGGGVVGGARAPSQPTSWLCPCSRPIRVVQSCKPSLAHVNRYFFFQESRYQSGSGSLSQVWGACRKSPVILTDFDQFDHMGHKTKHF